MYPRWVSVLAFCFFTYRVAYPLFPVLNHGTSQSAIPEKNAPQGAHAGTRIPTSSSSPTSRARRRLDPVRRATRFDELYSFVKNHIGRNPVAHDALQVRNSAWMHLFGLATQPAQLERVTELFFKWRESGRHFDDKQVQAFIRK